ncbi:FecR family protein [Devosia soli]|uniref:FecR family protein n=1 Tax=Devosia soli TaxID=361041 RepID=UPI00069CBB1A|nr:FecR family protein [Devosia soli]
MRRRGFAALLHFGVSFVLSGAASAAHGQAVGVDSDAIARFSGTDRILAVGAGVSLGEQIVTGPSGQVQIIFSDRTRLVVGPGNALIIGTTTDKFALNAWAHNFRFNTGRSPKPAYSIKTPTAPIAVRGTKFDFNVQPQRTELLLYEGAVRLCAGSNYTDITVRCELGIAERGDSIVIDQADPKHQALSQKFRYARFQSPLFPNFRVNGTSQCTQPAQDSGVAQQLSPTNGGGNELVIRPPTRN